MTTTLEPTALALPASMQRIDTFDAASAEQLPGRQLRMIREAAPGFRSWFATTGQPDYVATCDLVSLPYPTRFGLFRAHLSPAPYLTITNRMQVVRWREPDGKERTLLNEPSDHELGVNTPYFADLTRKTPAFVESVIATRHGDVRSHLQRLGIRPEEVDYISFDHLHTQDVRRLIGTRGPAPDISPSQPIEPLLPNARLLVQRREWEAMPELHPLQRRWYQPDTYLDLRDEAITLIDGDVLLGPGVALLATPGHTAGNQSLVLNTDTGIWAISENVIAAECLTPEHSRIPGLRRASNTWDFELVLNANTIEDTADQYNSCVKEKLIVDRSRRDHRFLQFFPSSELTRSRLSPMTAPTFTHGGIHHGALRA